MKVFQKVIAVITVFMVLSMFGMSIWVNSRFSVSGTAQCYMPINIIATVLVLITVITIFVKDSNKGH